MADKLIVTKDGIKEVNFTEEEKQNQLEQKKKEDIKYTVIEEKPNESQIKLAEYVLELEDWKEKANQKLSELRGDV